MIAAMEPQYTMTGGYGWVWTFAAAVATVAAWYWIGYVDHPTWTHIGDPK